MKPWERESLAAALLASWLLCAGCSGGDDDDDGAALPRDGGGAGSGADAAGPSKPSAVELFGAFTIEYQEALAGQAAQAVASGQVFDAESLAIDSRRDSEAGDCVLLVPDFPACGACDGVCIADGDCRPAPNPVDAGDVAIEGTRGGDVELSRDPRMFFYQADSVLAVPPCEEGRDVTVRAQTFTATAPCIVPLELLTPEPVAVKTGSSVPLRWTPPADANDSRIKIKLDISHHGGKKGEIACDVADSGSFELPEALVSKLVALGVAAQPTIGLRREATAQASGQSGVRFTIGSPVERAVDTGFAACAEGEPCPQGTKCDQTTKICR